MTRDEIKSRLRDLMFAIPEASEEAKAKKLSADYAFQHVSDLRAQKRELEKLLEKTEK